MHQTSCASTEDNCVPCKPAFCCISCISTQKEKSGWQSSLIPDASTTMCCYSTCQQTEDTGYIQNNIGLARLYVPVQEQKFKRDWIQECCLCSCPRVSIFSKDLGYRTFLLSSLLPSSSTHSSICFSSSNPSTHPFSSRGQSLSDVGQTQWANPSPNPLLPLSTQKFH